MNLLRFVPHQAYFSLFLCLPDHLGYRSVPLNLKHLSLFNTHEPWTLISEVGRRQASPFGLSVLGPPNIWSISSGIFHPWFWLVIVRFSLLHEVHGPSLSGPSLSGDQSFAMPILLVSPNKSQRGQPAKWVFTRYRPWSNSWHTSHK